MITNNLDRFGYYMVGGKKHFNKILALETATQSGEVPVWNFNDELFGSIDCTQDLGFSLEEAYRMRAEQIRAKYDYVILSYSGGSDSHNILSTFLKHNIKLDAVVVFGTFDFDRDKNNDNNVEQYKVAIPFAQQYQDSFEVIILDISSYYEKYYHADWIYNAGPALYPSELTQNMIWQDPEIQKWLDKGSTALIKGIDKPRVIYKDGRFYFAFLDCLMAGAILSVMLDEQQSVCNHVELFYWTPDAPWLVVKQAQVIKNYVKNIRPDLIGKLTHTSRFSSDFMQNYIVPLIYDMGFLPGEPPNYFTVGKSWHSPVFNIKEKFFHSTNSMELKSQKLWRQGVEHVQTIVDPRFINNSNISYGLQGFWSKWHDLGT